MKLIIEIPEDWEKGIKNMYDWDIANFLYETCRNGTPIPDNATNGNSVIKMFCKGIVRISPRKNVSVEFNKDWWNSPYQKGGKE